MGTTDLFVAAQDRTLGEALCLAFTRYVEYYTNGNPVPLETAANELLKTVKKMTPIRTGPPPTWEEFHSLVHEVMNRARDNQDWMLHAAAITAHRRFVERDSPDGVPLHVAMADLQEEIRRKK
jgi:hypothetical protein